MGTFKKQISAAITLTLALGLVFLSACKKEAGPAGKDGKDGNTNVKVYLFAGANLTSGLFYITNNIPIRFSAVDSSVVLAYHKSGGYWFSIPEELQGLVKYIGKDKKTFCAWGHCGACGDGAFQFQAIVNVWEIFLEDIY